MTLETSVVAAASLLLLAFAVATMPGNPLGRLYRCQYPTRRGSPMQNFTSVSGSVDAKVSGDVAGKFAAELAVSGSVAHPVSVTGTINHIVSMNVYHYFPADGPPMEDRISDLEQSMSVLSDKITALGAAADAAAARVKADLASLNQQVASLQQQVASGASTEDILTALDNVQQTVSSIDPSGSSTPTDGGTSANPPADQGAAPTGDQGTAPPATP